jgi:phage gpG-like protein
MNITADFAGALRKTATLKAIPKAVRRVMQKWGAESVTDLKESARSMQKSSRGSKLKGRKTGQLARSVNMKMAANTLAVGTNVTRATDVKYARIQDEGGSTFPRVTKKSRKFFWMMYYLTDDEKYKWMALTKQERLRVKIPESRWFSDVMLDRETLLHQYMDPGYLYQVAEQSVGLGGAE